MNKFPGAQAEPRPGKKGTTNAPEVEATGGTGLVDSSDIGRRKSLM